MTIINTGTEPDRLIGGSTPAAGKFEIHEMTMDGGVMKMRPLPNGLEIKPGQTVEFKPGSYHLMFVGLKAAVREGQARQGHAAIREGRHGRGRIRGRGGRRHAGMDHGDGSRHARHAAQQFKAAATETLRQEPR